jgi:hypothetical protein
MRAFQIYAHTRTNARTHTHTHTHTPRASSRAVKKGTVVEARAVEAEAVEVEEELEEDFSFPKANVVARALQYNNTSNLLQKGP